MPRPVRLPRLDQLSKGRSVAKKQSSSDVPKRRKYRIHPGTGALREIRRQQKRVNRVLARKPFKIFVRDVATGLTSDNVRFTANAFESIQWVAEDYLLHLLFNANRMAIVVGRRKTVMPIDLKMTKKLLSGGLIELR